MSYRIGSGYKASSNLQTSVANQEILPSPPVNSTVPYYFYKLSLINDADCHLILNNDGEQKFIRAGQGFEIDEKDFPIYSLKIVENGVLFNYFAAY